MKNLITCLAVSLLSSVAFADTWTVDDDGNADFDYIQSAVNDDPIKTEDCCEIECGTLETPEAIKQTQRMLANGTWDEGRMHPLNHRGTQYVRITAHVVRYSNGTGGLPQSRIDTAIEDLNNHVVSTGLVFFQDGDTLFIDSDQYANCETSEMDALRQIDVVDSSVNIYFVPETSICGRSSFYGMGVQGIVMNNDCTANPSIPNYSTFSHELGHYFNLWHTHTTSLGGAECVDGSNCSIAGDLFCDTPADPNVYGLVSDSCVYTGTVIDACGSGALYNPSTENLMSYSNKWCRDTFTSEQLSMFLWSAENQRADHIVNSDCPEDINGDGYVDVSDLLAVIDQWGLTDSPADINGDGIVDISDLLIVVGNWGPCGGGSNVWTVDDDGGADFYYIQDAIDAASDGDEILVYPGTYTDTGLAVVDMMGKEVWLHSSEGPEVTIIDGENARRVIFCYSGETPKTKIEGFAITDGFAESNGGGIGTDSSPTIANCIISGNWTSGHGGGADLRGLNCAATITDCTFSNNVANYDGGGLCYTAGATIKITNCVIADNNAYRWVGGLVALSEFDALPGTITNCIIRNNTAEQTEYTGGAYFFGDCTMTETTVCGNVPSPQTEGDYTDGGGNTVADTCSGDPTGACCVGTSCSIGTDADCTASGGTYLGDGSSCNGDPCGGGSNVWTVDDDGGADFDNIQDAVDVAADGDEIIVYPGTYTDTGTAVVDTLGKTLTIHSSDGSDATFIDGQYERRGIYCSGESPTHVTISGFTIREGTPQDGGSSSDGGGLLSLGDLTLSDCMFELCAASSQGGGLAVGTNPFPTGQTVNIDDCTFQNNTANYSGAMMAYDCNLTMSNCQVLNNTGTDNIGGLTVGHTVSGYSSHLENITISENTSPGGALGKTGGLSLRDGSNVSMQSCVVVNNSSLTEGGGISVWLPSANLQEGLRFDVDGNPTSKRSRFGGGYILISNCLVRDNISTGSGAGVYLEGNGATLSDSTVCGNTTDQIIGAYNDGGGNTVADTCP